MENNMENEMETGIVGLFIILPPKKDTTISHPPHQYGAYAIGLQVLQLSVAMIARSSHELSQSLQRPRHQPQEPGIRAPSCSFYSFPLKVFGLRFRASRLERFRGF